MAHWPRPAACPQRTDLKVPLHQRVNVAATEQLRQALHLGQESKNTSGPALGGRVASRQVAVRTRPVADVTRCAEGFGGLTAEVVREIALALGAPPTEKIGQLDAGDDVAQKLEYLLRMVLHSDLAKLASRLTRRTCGLGGLWEEFCGTHGQRGLIPERAKAAFLVHFICHAIADEPSLVVLVKGPYPPFAAVAVAVAQRHAEQGLNHRTWSAHAALHGPGGHPRRRGEESTRSGSVDSKGSSSGGHTEGTPPLAPAPAPQPIASLSWLGPEPGSPSSGAGSAGFGASAASSEAPRPRGFQ